MYSAIKKDGKKLYEYARAGITIEREPREVTIYSIDDIKVKLPEVSFKVHCSKGTYIRSLCRDIGRELGSLATLKELKRSEVNGYKAEDALRLDEVRELFESGLLGDRLIAMDSLLNRYRAVNLKPDKEKYLLNGNRLTEGAFEDAIQCDDGELVRVYSNGRFMALYEYAEHESIFTPYKMFL